MSDLSTWLTKQQAADAIGVSTKAVERFTRAGKLQQAFRAQAGSPHVAVYEPADVARLAAERQPGPLPAFLMPAGAPPTNGNGDHAPGALARVSAGLGSQLSAIGPGEDLLRVLVVAASRVMSETSQTPTLFLTLPEASAATGLTQAYLRRRCEDGTLKAIRDRGWRIRRKDLEQL